MILILDFRVGGIANHYIEPPTYAKHVGRVEPFGVGVLVVGIPTGDLARVRSGHAGLGQFVGQLAAQLSVLSTEAELLTSDARVEVLLPVLSQLVVQLG